MSKKKDKEPDKKTNWFFIIGAVVAALLAVTFGFLAGHNYEPGPEQPDDIDKPGNEADT